MKRFVSSIKKQISLLLIFTMIFSMFSGVIVVNADPTVLSIKYERVRENTLSGPIETNRLLIYGNGFVNPKVKAGQVSEIPIPVNTGLSNSDVIVIDDQATLDSIEGIINNITIMNNGTDPITVTGGIELDLTSIPTLTNTSKSKVYINESLEIDGMFFDGLDAESDELFIAGTKYLLDDTSNVTIDTSNNKISIKNVKSPISTGVSDVTIIRKLDGSPMYQIVTTLKKSITVVDRLKNIDIERIDPNTGPRTKRNLVNIYGKPGYSNFNSGMRVFVNGSEGTNKGTISNLAGTVIGLSVELPTTNVSGATDIILTNSDLSSEYVITNGFIYLDIGNTLSIENDGINPNYKKETEAKLVTIAGRNIGYFDAANYDKLSNITTPTNTLIGYNTYNNIPQFNNKNTYKVIYKGLYDNKAVTIMKQINVFIDGEATIENSPAPMFTKSKDTLVVTPADVNLDPNQPKSVDVTVKTNTMVFDETNTANIVIYYSRSEEYTIKNGFTYIPNEVTPTITSITPDYGPSDKDIYMTIKGFNFQVMDVNGVATQPKVTIGGRDAVDVVVYDNQNRIVDGKKIPVGTKIKLKLPAGTGQALNGAKDVVVKNPSQGQFTVINGFEFKNPSRLPARMPSITSVKESFADMRGGLLTGQTIVITGENFDTALEANHRVTITIDGEKADIKGKVSADGKTVTIIPPPGTRPGETKLQLINEDGSMDSEFFEYRMAVTSPMITKITPTKGGNGTLLVIKGEDFVLPDLSTNHDDPRHKGTVVMLGGRELNAYNYDVYGAIKSDGTDIYYNNGTINGKMVEVQDSNTIYIHLSDKFYSFNTANGATAPFLKSEDIPLGDLKVEVLNPDGAKSKENITFTYVRPATFPTITSITPASGSIDGGTVVTIIGSNFKQDQLKVFFASEEAKEIQFINSTELRVKVPIYPYELPLGKDNIKIPVMVMNYDGGMAVEEDGFEYRIPGSQPIITSLSPARGSAAGNEQVIIRGRDFRREPVAGIIPKVYFNGIEAKVDWLSSENVSELLLVTTPPSKIDGPVDVVIVNHDSGSYTFKSFNYEISKPVINSVTPNSINKLGGNKLQINGTGFKKADLKELLNGEYVDRHIVSNKKASDQIDTLVIFGDATTSDKKIIDTVMGLPYVDLGDLRVSYSRVNASTSNVKIAKVSSPNTFIKDMNIPFGSSHMFIINGPEDLGDTTIGDEGILVEVTPNQVMVTRRIATFAKWENDGLQITAIAPAVGGIGTRKLYVQNADGGIGSYDINVLNPASNPTITYISPRNKVKKGDTIVDYSTESAADQEYYTYTPLKGGAFVTINGTDFRRNVKVYLDNKELEIVSRSLNDDQLVVKVPSGTEADLDKLYRILVVNEDGGSADSSSLSKPHYIVYKMPQSKPIVESVVPAFTSSKGQNVVKIIGDDFRDGAKVFIDGVESPSVTRINYKELAVRIPLGLTPGKKLIQVMNPDYGFGEKKDALTIISSPEIDTVYDNTKNQVLSPVLLSIDGNQSIKLMGADFLSGVKVIIGGTLKPKSELQSGETGIKCYNINDVEMVIVGGSEGTNVKILNNTTLTFTTPKLKTGSYNIIVVNSDGGVSNEISTSYQKPKPDVPGAIAVEVVDSDTIKLEWDKVLETSHYEIYAAYSSNGTIVNNYVYVGSVQAYEVSEGRLRYYVDGLKANSWYSFKLKSVNSYGPSTLSFATTYVKTKATKLTASYYQTEGDYVSGVAQNDKVDMIGSSLTFTAGEKSFSTYGSSLVVYLNQASYNSYNPKNVDVAIGILKRYSNTAITINEKDFSLKMLSNNLYVAEARAVPATKLTDAKMTVGINKDLRAKGDEIKVKLPTGYKSITAPVAINLTMQVEQNKTSIKALNGNADIKYNVTEDLKRKYVGGIYVAYYNNQTKKLDILSTAVSGNTATAKASKSGEYILIGKFTR